MPLMAMNLQAKHTFLQFDLACDFARPRRKSAPPEVFVELVVDAARRREEAKEKSSRRTRRPRHKQRKSKQRVDDEQALVEWTERAREERCAHLAERWAHLADSLIVASLKVARDEAKKFAVAKKAAGRRPLLRTTLDKKAFAQVAALTRLRVQEITALCCGGVLRWRGENVEIWSKGQGLQHCIVQALLREADRIIELTRHGACQMSVNGGRPFTFADRRSLTVESLRRAAKSAYGIHHAKLTHLGQEMLTGPLEDHGVGPGSFVMVYPLVVNSFRRMVDRRYELAS